MISVLTPSWNYGRFIEEAVLSVQFQAERHEHIVQDAVSVDDTQEILARYPAVKLRRETDAGQSDALRRALSRSAGEWIGWLNADEFYLPGAFEAVLAAAADASLGVVFGDAVMVGESGEFLRLLPTHRPGRWSLGYSGPILASCATFVRRSLLERYAWDPELRWIMDWDLWLAFNLSGARFGHVTRPLAAYRVHAGQVTQAAGGIPPGELTRMRHRHGLRTGRAAAALRGVGLAAHATRKIADDAYRRQRWATRQLQGSTLGWSRSGFIGNAEALDTLAQWRPCALNQPS